jgi:hypothetical protein
VPDRTVRRISRAGFDLGDVTSRASSSASSAISSGAAGAGAGGGGGGGASAGDLSMQMLRAIRTERERLGLSLPPFKY